MDRLCGLGFVVFLFPLSVWLPLGSRAFCDLQNTQATYHKPPNHWKQFLPGHPLSLSSQPDLSSQILSKQDIPYILPWLFVPQSFSERTYVRERAVRVRARKNTVEKRRGMERGLQAARRTIPARWCPGSPIHGKSPQELRAMS